MSLPCYSDFGWEPTVICVQEKYCEGFVDKTLLYSVPDSIKIHKIKALPANITRKIGLGSLSLRSLLYYKYEVSKILNKEKYDLIFFSTTMFHVCSLGPFWKKKYKIPFVIDMQDPWRNDIYLDKPVEMRPPKYKIAYEINKQMEGYTMPNVDGLMSVSQGYLDELQNRYPVISTIPKKVIPFGYSKNDHSLIDKFKIESILKDDTSGKIKVVYMGAVTQLFIPLIRAFFISLNEYSNNLLCNYHFYFIGTNYSKFKVSTYIHNLALELNLSQYITEIPARISYLESLATIKSADILFIPGSMDANYNASKIYNNLFSGIPVFTIFNEKSLVLEVARETGSSVVVSVNENDDDEQLKMKIKQAIPAFSKMHLNKNLNNENKLLKYSAENLTGEQVELFNQVVHCTN
jgi:hypothetical protein